MCHEEAIKLATLINNHTPVLSSDPFLSHLIAALVSNSVKTAIPTTETPTNLPTNKAGRFVQSFIVCIFLTFSYNIFNF